MVRTEACPVVAVVFIAAILSSAALSAEEQYPWRGAKVEFGRVGGVGVGMTVAQASDAFAVSFLDATWFYGDNDCASYAFGKSKFGQDWDIRFLAEDKLIQRIDVYSPAIPHPKGFNVGDRLEDLLAGVPGRYTLMPAQDEGVRYIQIQEEGYASSYTVYLDFESRRDAASPLMGVIKGWSIGNVNAGSIEGCL